MDNLAIIYSGKPKLQMPESGIPAFAKRWHRKTVLPKIPPVKFLMNREKVRIGSLSEFTHNRNYRKRSNSELLRGTKRTSATLGCIITDGKYRVPFPKT